MKSIWDESLLARPDFVVSEQGAYSPPNLAYVTVQDIPGEKPFLLDGTRWQWVMLVQFDGTPIGPRYYHAPCDALVDDAGRCVLCRAASPALLLEKALL